MGSSKRIVVLGVGNLLLKDEGLGVHVVRRLTDMVLPPHVEVMDGGTGGLDLLDYIEGRDKVVIVDTVKGGQPPGTIYRMTPEDMEEQPKSRLSLHEIDVADLLKVADMLGVKRPEIVIIGVEPKDMESASLELSPEIEARVPRVIELVLKEIGG
ncbi:MAG: HyaD/HybD family hydrogenase maturation endopeptidase [Planctomycetota bacterium]